MKKILLFISFSLVLLSCETTNLDGTDDPRALSSNLLNKDYMLNNIQTDFAGFFSEIAKGPSRNCSRMTNQFGNYANESDPQNTQGAWSSGYSTLKQIDNLEKNASEASYPYHLGVAKVLKAYTYVTLVDFYGDIPYTEALDSNNLNPKADSGEFIYDSMISELNKAIALLSLTAPMDMPDTDLYFTGTSTFDPSKWIKVANSLKIKMYNNLRLTRDVSSQVNAIVSSGNYISSNADDFNFKYSSSNSPVDSRHPEYAENYDGSPEFYLSNTFYKLMFFDKSVVDPRRRFYFYRQTSSAPSGQNLPCSGNSAIPICYVGVVASQNGYWGRDHADNTGIPNDGTRRTVIGLYPFGGRFDANNFQNAATSTASNNANGAGILNILDYSFVKFMLAELSLTETGVNGTPATYLSDAVSSNITKVTTFRTDLATSATLPSTSTINSYKTAVNNSFTVATSTDDKLNVIIKEFYIAAWGNGMEAYNMYRRTGMPLHNSNYIGMQSPVISSTGFISSFPYPMNAINNNTSLIQHSRIKQVFWDNHPTGFVD